MRPGMNITGQYMPGDSVIHRLDPRVKIIATVLLSISILRGTLPAWTGLTVFLLTMFPVAGLPLRHGAIALRPVRFFLLLFFLLHLVCTPGETIQPLSWGGIAVTYQGLSRGTIVVWQFCLLLWGAAILTATTSPSELVMAIDRLLSPLGKIGVPSHDIATMVSIALRFFPVFLEEMEKIREAQEARGADFKAGGPVKRAKAASGLLVPLLFSFMRRAEGLAVAMEARAYVRGPRTSLRDLHMARTDYVALGVTVLVIGLPVVAKFLTVR